MWEEKRTSSERAGLERAFDETARKWKSMPREGNEAVVQSLWEKLIEYGFMLYDNGTERFLESFVKFFRESYRPDQKASHYFKYISRRRKYETETDDRREVSIDAETEDGENAAQRTLDSQTHLTRPDPVSEGEEFDATAALLIASVLNMQERLHGKSDNPVKRKYYRMFFTDDMVFTIQCGALAERLKRHERDLFQAFETSFLDFFLSSICRSVEAVAGTPVKLYSELVPGRDEKEPGHPLPNDVYRKYLGEVEEYEVKSDGAVSNQRDAYRKFLRESLC